MFAANSVESVIGALAIDKVTKAAEPTYPACLSAYIKAVASDPVLRARVRIVTHNPHATNNRACLSRAILWFST